MLRGALLPQSRTVLSESASYLLIFLLSKTMSLISQIIWCVWTWSHRHTIPVRGSRLWELLFSTVNTIKIWERQNSNPIFFHLSWAPLSSPQFFPPQIQPKQFLDTTGRLFQQPHEWMSRCLPELQTWRWWMCIRTLLRWGIAVMGTCQQSGQWEHCVSKILSALGFDQTSVCCWLYRLQEGSQACPITASNPLKTILHFF